MWKDIESLMGGQNQIRLTWSSENLSPFWSLRLQYLNKYVLSSSLAYSFRQQAVRRPPFRWKYYLGRGAKLAAGG